MKGRHDMNTTTGIAAAFSFKTIMTAVVSLGVAAVVAVGGYAVATNYVLFPEFNEALANTLEAKNEPLTEFDTEKFKEEGKTEISLDIPELKLDAKLSLSHSENALQAALKTCGETFTVSYKDLNVAVSAEGFNKGEAYGFSLKNLRKNIMDSIFAADSGTDYEIPMDTINEICDIVEKITEPKEMTKEYERAYEFVIEVFEKSEMAKDASVSYSKLEVLGEERSGRSQILTINQDYVVKLIEDYAEAFDNLKGKDLEAVEYVLEDVENTFDVKVDIDDIVETLEEAADTLEEIEELEDLEITYSVCYVGKYLSAVVAAVEYKNNDIDADIEGCITVDFGAKPNKTREIIINASLEGEVNDEKADMFAEVVIDAKKDGDKIVYSADLTAEANVPGEEKMKASGKSEIVLDSKKEKATVTVSANVAGEEMEFFAGEYDFTDSKEKFSMTPKSFEIMGEKIEIPFDVTVTMYREPDKIKANKYTDILDMSEKEFEDLGEDLEDYITDFAEDLSEELEGLGDVFEGFGDIFDAFDGIGLPGIAYPEDYPDDEFIDEF